ncbi:hypothetical protein [Bacillus gobiensis]|uniref:hypothetical protein n=1 Tax=Bacillus gobiensis TaxID=1441095 RepID=UPI000A5866B9|nr:hypothetical protein [Bacillus gobiensis]
MEPMVKEFELFMQENGHVSFEELLPDIQTELWRIARKYKTTGDKVFHAYMDWKVTQVK